ncbi:MAG: FG-GAP-like repeat-containing protein [Pseudomonadota bacterium]
MKYIFVGSLALVVATAPEIVWSACIEGPTGECLSDALQPIDLESDRGVRGRADLAVGISTNALPNGTQTGAVAIYRGRSRRVLSTIPLEADQLLVRPPGAEDSLDSFGSASVMEDFDQDGFEDAIVGISGGRRADLPERPGLAAYFRGSDDGLTYDRLITKGLRAGGLPGVFGHAIIAGDFDGDGAPDLAIGSPGDPTGDIIPGAVFAYRNTGRTPEEGGQFVPPVGLELIPFDAQDMDNVGWALAAGDLDGDGAEELIIGAPGRTVDGVDDAGEIYIYGAQGGQIAVPRQRITLSDFDQPITASRFGQAIEVADFDADGLLDLAIGAPAVSLVPTGATVTGKVYILRNTGNGFELASVLDQTGMDDQNDEEAFGFALAAGDMNGDGLPELAVGAPYNMTAPRDNALIAIDVPTTFIISNMRRWRNDARIMRGRSGLTPSDVLSECFEPEILARPLIRPGGGIVSNEPARSRMPDALADERSRFTTLPRPGDPPLPVQERPFNCNFLIPETNRPPIRDRTPKRTGRVFLFKNDSGTLVPEGMLGAGAPHPTQAEALIGFSLKAADFNGDGYADLVSGATGKRPQSGGARGGAAEVFIGGMGGLKFVGELDQTGLSPNIEQDRFGASLDR